MDWLCFKESLMGEQSDDHWLRKKLKRWKAKNKMFKGSGVNEKVC